MISDKGRDYRNWFALLLLLLLGAFALWLSASNAARLPGEWVVIASIRSFINPDESIALRVPVEVAPVLQAILTPAPWDPEDLLGDVFPIATIVPQDGFQLTATAESRATPTPEEPAVVETQPVVPTATKVDTPVPTPTQPTNTPRPSETPTLTVTPTALVPSATPTVTVTPLPTATRTTFPTATRTPAPQPTDPPEPPPTEPPPPPPPPPPPTDPPPPPTKEPPGKP